MNKEKLKQIKDELELMKKHAIICREHPKCEFDDYYLLVVLEALLEDNEKSV